MYGRRHTRATSRWRHLAEKVSVDIQTEGLLNAAMSAPLAMQELVSNRLKNMRGSLAGLTLMFLRHCLCIPKYTYHMSHQKEVGLYDVSLYGSIFLSFMVVWQAKPWPSSQATITCASPQRPRSACRLRLIAWPCACRSTRGSQWRRCRSGARCCPT